MIDKKLEALLNEEIDGVTTAEASAELKRILDSDPEARSLYQDLRRVSELLGRVPMEDPPPELKQNILRGIEPLANRRNNPGRTPEQGGWFKGFSGLFQGFRPAYGLSFAGGAAFGLVVFLLANQTPRLTPDSVTATMSPPRAFEAMETVERKPFSVPGAGGLLETRIASGSVLARVEIDAPTGADLIVRFDPGGLKPRGVQVSETPSGDISLVTNEIRITHQGRNTYWITFEQAGKQPEKLDIRISSKDQVLEESLKTMSEPGN